MTHLRHVYFVLRRVFVVARMLGGCRGRDIHFPILGPQSQFQHSGCNATIFSGAIDYPAFVSYHVQAFVTFRRESFAFLTSFYIFRCFFSSSNCSIWSTQYSSRLPLTIRRKRKTSPLSSFNSRSTGQRSDSPRDARGPAPP